MFNKNLVLISGACIFRDFKGQNKWFLIKQQEEDGWEIPKVLVRKGESSVRAVLRLMGEKGGMTTRVLEEAGRAGGVTTINGRTFPQRHIFYLMVAKSMANEVLGFEEYQWLDYSHAVKKLTSKREKSMLKAAKETLELWRKKREKKKS
jgi:hypothetical protein